MGLLNRLEVSAEGDGSRFLDNEDLRATPPEKRTWDFKFYCLFWLAAVTNVSNWLSGSSFLALGVGFWPGVSLWMIACGRPGARWNVRIGFPVVCRSSFGVFGAGWPALNRVNGAQALYVMLYAIFPSFRHTPKNTMSSGSALTSGEMICFFVFLVFNILMLMVDIRKWVRLTYAKIAVYCISSAGMLALAVTKAGGVGPIVTHGGSVTGSAKHWLHIQMILTSAASCSTFASNASDWQRMARRPNDPIPGQFFGFPLANFFTNVVGMLVASCSQPIYGELVWNPVTFLKMLLEDNYDAKHRAGAFFIAFGFVFSLLFSATVENVYPCGNDLAALCPRYISVKRGFFICIAISIALNPWYLLGSAAKFITVLSSYQIFLFSIAAIIMADYFLVSKGFFVYNDLYHRRKEGTYWYTYGLNWRAFVAYFLGVGCNFAGFLNNLGVIHNTKLQRSYYFAIFSTTFVAGGSYWLLTRLFPQPNMRDSWSEPKGLWIPPECQAASEDTVSEDKKEDSMAADVQEVPVHELRE
ncbi:hypothetical protein Rhopal_007469-T1 [Rhodotorula paludigena]|uniref:Uncharacterized protein n=1 Tax=Rhodotorula paludigena TaxID=86838 RepID=A0AAV5GV33_9BASI|nr:hypothetical protein Rhopal_007469-T1 [Rhodotorula paludigena]